MQPLQAAIASTDGAVRLENPVGTDWAFRTRMAAAASADTVPAYSVASLLRRSPGCTPFLAKIDIEGFEEELFSSNLDWVDHFPILIIELHDWLMPRQSKARNFLRAVQARERDFVILGESICSIAHNLARAAATANGGGTSS